MTRTKAFALSVFAGLLFCGNIITATSMSAQGTGALVMVVNASASSTVSKPEAKRILLGQMTTLPNGSKVIVVIKAAGSKERATILKDICGMSESEYTRFQMQLAFTGTPATVLHEADSAAATKSFMKAKPRSRRLSTCQRCGCLSQSCSDARMRIESLRR